MDEFVEVSCRKDFKGTLVENVRHLSDESLRRIDEIWDKEFQIRQGSLYNGDVLGIVSASDEELLVEKVEYKLVLALLRDPRLSAEISFKPLSTSGMTISSGAVLIGQRSQYVSSYPNFYEMVPSGSIDCSTCHEGIIDLREQLVKELTEEADIHPSYIESTEGWSLIYDVAGRGYEVVARLRVKEFISSSPKHMSEGEYRSLIWLPKEEFEKHLMQHIDHYVPLTKHLYYSWKELI
ncbi:hypothetical protein [Estrella lausannensis]|uniref:NUDIX hydrolase n=1 Tax=Estrella lausannensis TaxID=483423 RepID=A0A0H5E7C2_9BACT|nr:hypothetical protein [Estrella lausannensis]CRX39230.1 NUDIX hydrolase [Estrella lausannensis]